MRNLIALFVLAFTLVLSASAQEANSGFARRVTYQTLTDAAPIAWSLSSAVVGNAIVTLNHATGTRALNVSNLLAGGDYKLFVHQDATGGAALTFGTGCTWKVSGNGSGAITLTSTASAVDLLTIRYDGTTCWTTLTANFN